MLTRNYNDKEINKKVIKPIGSMDRSVKECGWRTLKLVLEEFTIN